MKPSKQIERQKVITTFCLIKSEFFVFFCIAFYNNDAIFAAFSSICFEILGCISGFFWLIWVTV